MQDIPKTTNGVIISEDSTLKFGEFPLPELGENDLLIKVHSAPINPSDQYSFVGLYADGKGRPALAGLEGSGLVVATGTTDKAKALLNKRVAFFTGSKSGTWAEHNVTSADNAFPLPENVDYEQGAMYLVNPLTVQGLLNLCEDNKYTAVASSAAASQVGRMFIKAAKEAGITVVNFVRREAQVQVLKDLGADHVINRGQEGWEEEAKKVTGEVKVQAFFDALGGPDAGAIISTLPDGAITYNYGLLTLKPLQISGDDLIFKRKEVKGYWLATDLRSPDAGERTFARAFSRIATGVFHSVIGGRFTHENFQQALDAYASNMTKGKVLIQNANFGEN